MMHLTNGRGASESFQAASPFLNLVTCEWNSVFAKRRPETYNIENKPYIQTRKVDENIVRTFMKDSDESDVCLPQADKVEAYCFGANLEYLEAEKGEASIRLVACLDERSFAARGEGNGGSRPYRGTLTARDLYQELKKPRFRCIRSSGFDESGETTGNLSRDTPAQDESQKQEEKEGKEDEPDADRRLIFITDLDCWSMYALIGTASSSQARALRGALYKHLAFENFIGVTFPPNGVKMFHLEFHLPYYVWRESKKAREDHRRDANARPLRQSINISFLDWKSSGSSSFLYEAQISCLVVGSDEWTWVAYCFVDNYFDAAGEGKETVQSYHEESLDEDDEGMRTDPFTFGACEADKPIWPPRDYFLAVFRIRLKKIKCEWQKVIEKVQQSVREYTHDYSLSLSGERSSSKEAVDHDDRIRKSRNWVVRVRMLSKQLSMDLSKTVNACERFCLKYAVYFQDQSERANSHLSLAAIQTTFDELESQKKTLEFLAARCEDFARDLECQLIIENLEVGNRQHKVSQDTKRLSIIMMVYISPIALASAMLSMRKGVIPFISESFGCFVVLVFIFSVLGIFIYFVFVYRTWCWQVARNLARYKPWGKKIKRWRYIETLHSTRNFLFGLSTTQNDVAQLSC